MYHSTVIPPNLSLLGLRFLGTANLEIVSLGVSFSIKRFICDFTVTKQKNPKVRVIREFRNASLQGIILLRLQE